MMEFGILEATRNDIFTGKNMVLQSTVLRLGSTVQVQYSHCRGTQPMVLVSFVTL